MTTALPISIQISTYNEEENIDRCIRSVLRQGVQEILVIDGKSQDRTVEIVSRYPGVKCIESPRKGLAFQRALGVSMTSLDWVAFVDADDALNETWARDLYSELVLGNYHALQSRLKAVGSNENTIFVRGWEHYFKTTIVPSSDSKMVGRPALFEKKALDAFFSSQSFNPNLIAEDTLMAIYFEKRGYRQGVSSSSSFSTRRVPETFSENVKKFLSYGKAYSQIVQHYPDKRESIEDRVLKFSLSFLLLSKNSKFDHGLVLFRFIRFFGIFLGYKRHAFTSRTRTLE